MVESFGLQRTVGYQEFRLFDIRKISTFVENQQIFFYSPISKEYKFRLLKIRDKKCVFSVSYCIWYIMAKSPKLLKND